jgi:hypothetical protein
MTDTSSRKLEAGPLVDFLLELGCEEIPARFLQSLSMSFKTEMLTALSNANIPFESDTVTKFDDWVRPYRRVRHRKVIGIMPRLGLQKNVGLMSMRLRCHKMKRVVMY